MLCTLHERGKASFVPQLQPPGVWFSIPVGHTTDLSGSIRTIMYT